MTRTPAEERPQMLFARRNRLKQMAEAEAKGQSFWTELLDEKARRKLLYQVQDLKESVASSMVSGRVDFIAKARDHVLRDTGLVRLSNSRSQFLDSTEDALLAIVNAEEEVVFSLIEALISLPNKTGAGLLDFNIIISPHEAEVLEVLKEFLPNFIENVRTILQEHRVEYDIVEGQFIPFRSRIMHESVVIPTITLLGNNKKYDNVEKAYWKALAELHDGSPDDAITDASTALQEALSTLGCEGNSLGPLANSAVVKKVIDRHDRKLIDWVSADRSTKGDAHYVSSASTEDAWLAVHVVGAIILRICGRPLRSSGEAR